MQKPFSFYLLPFSFLLALCAGCSMNPNLQGEGVANLQGEWQQDSIPMQKKLVEYSLYHFKFSCDSFYMRISSFSKVNNGADTCMNRGHWTEYVKGNYQQRNDTLHLKGQFCNANFTLKEPGGCFRAGIYEDFFKIVKKSDSLIKFSITSSVIPVNARLIKHTTCNPKPL